MRLACLRLLSHTSRTRAVQACTPRRRSNIFDSLCRPPPAFSQACRAFSSGNYAISEDEEDYDFGSFDVILPEEPYIWGVSHIQPRPVPPHVVRPPYARGVPIHTPLRDKLIQLGSKEEQRLRRAARLARDVLRFAGSLVEVRRPLGASLGGRSALLC